MSDAKTPRLDRGQRGVFGLSLREGLDNPENKPHELDLQAAVLPRAARWWASRGFSIFPVAPRSKEPHSLLAPHGFKNATTDPVIVDQWWRRCPNANVGFRTGMVFVVDL